MRASQRMTAVLYIVIRMQIQDQAEFASCRASDVGATLRVLRREAGVTQATLAQRLGTTQSAVARMELGRARTSLEWVERAAAALGCEVGLVFDRTRD